MSEIEGELVKAAKFNGKKYPGRQEYLAELLKAIDNKIKDDAYEKLSDGAVDWHQAAVKAFEGDIDIPDFPDADPEQEELPLEDDADAETSDAEGTDTQDDGAAEPDEADGEAEEAKAPKAKSEKAPAKKAKGPKRSIDYSTLTGDKDRYGIIIGTKTHEVVKMYEKGATAAVIQDELGGRHYNILRKLIKDGHKVEKMGDGVWKLTHKDEVKSKKK
jgi:hypothetical protein